MLKFDYKTSRWLDPGSGSIFQRNDKVEGEHFDKNVLLSRHYDFPSRLEIVNCTFSGDFTLDHPAGLRSLIMRNCTVAGKVTLACRLSHLELINVRIRGMLLVQRFRFPWWRSFLSLTDSTASEIVARSSRDAQRFHWAAPTIPVTFGV